MSNYPPGVTGGEYQISGPDKEEEFRYYCTECKQEVDGWKEWYRGEYRLFHDFPEQPDRPDHVGEWEYPDNNGQTSLNTSPGDFDR